MSRTRFPMLVMFLLAASAPTASAQVVYNFSAPSFALNEFTPLVNRAPNIGAGAFQTTFTSAPNPAAFQVSAFVPNVLFTAPGLTLGTGGDVLTLTFNQPATVISFDFALVAPGNLRLTDGANVVNVPSMVVGGPFQGGTLNYVNALGFTTLSLQGFSALNVPQQFAMDDLQLTPVPEPASMSLVGIAIGATWLARRWRPSR